MDNSFTQIGKYTLIKQLGAGGFGAVYLAEDPRLHQQVAIKVFQLKDAAIAQQATSSSTDAIGVLKQRFLEEARILRNHRSRRFNKLFFLGIPFRFNKVGADLCITLVY